MRRLTQLPGLLAFFAASLCPFSPVLADELSDQVDEIFEEYDDEKSPGMAVGVMREGEFLYKQGYGMADIARGIEITPATMFDIGSASKEYTGMSIALLVQEGKVDLEDDVHEYIPELPDYPQEVSVENLVHHTSGLPEYDYGDEEIDTMKEALEDIVENGPELDFEPDSKHEYTNTNYVLMARIVEKVSGKSFRKFVDERILGPLEMKKSFFHDDPKEVAPGMARGYAKEGGKWAIHEQRNGIVGDGSLITCIEDWVKWDANTADPELGSKPEEVQKIWLSLGDTDTGETDYAFGIEIDELDGHKMYQHAGAWEGFASYYLHIPDESLGVMVMSNIDGLDAEELAQKVARVYLAGDHDEEDEEGDEEDGDE